MPVKDNQRKINDYRKLEPRTSSSKNRIEALKTLTQAGIPTSVLMAPIIPGLNSNEINQLFKEVANAGAYNAFILLVRLNGQIADLFTDWL